MTVIWNNLQTMDPLVVSHYLKNEYPQTTALILTQFTHEYASKVIALLPESYAMEVMMRISRMSSYNTRSLNIIERGLIEDFENSVKNYRDHTGFLVEMFKHLGATEKHRFLAAIEERNQPLSEKITSGLNEETN